MVRSMLEILRNSDVQIILHDVEMDFEQDPMGDEEDDDLDMENYQDVEHGDVGSELPGVVDILTAARKIKIGRVEIIKGENNKKE